jgi:hypothetical protein
MFVEQLAEKIGSRKIESEKNDNQFLEIWFRG